jgi:hypothetical protein
MKTWTDSDRISLDSPKNLDFAYYNRSVLIDNYE